MFFFFFFRAMGEKRYSEWNTYQNCTKSLGLVKKQVKLCRMNLDLMRTVAHAAHIAITTCQEQFSDRRWNCSSLLKVPKLSRDLSRGMYNIMYMKYPKFDKFQSYHVTLNRILDASNRIALVVIPVVEFSFPFRYVWVRVLLLLC